jgi:undecaprenyl-diphosphatase
VILRFLILGIVQGATEFVPVSSSAHLVLVPWLLGWENPGLLFDTMVHWGTLLGLLIYFRHDVRELAAAWWNSVLRRKLVSMEARLSWLIILGTIPAALIGIIWEDFFEELFSSPVKVSSLLIVVGIIMLLGEKIGRRTRSINTVSPTDALLIGMAQGCAIAPGISRSGITIATGLYRGLERQDAAKFSFLLGIPIILGAGLTQIGHIPETINSGNDLTAIVVGFVSAVISGYLCIRFLLSYLRNNSLYPFVAYCWFIGSVCLILACLNLR